MWLAIAIIILNEYRISNKINFSLKPCIHCYFRGEHTPLLLVRKKR